MPGGTCDQAWDDIRLGVGRAFDFLFRHAMQAVLTHLLLDEVDPDVKVAEESLFFTRTFALVMEGMESAMPLVPLAV